MKVPFLFSVLAIVFLASYAEARRGGVSDGGGQGIVCRTGEGDVESAEVLDLFEAENYFLLKLEKPASGKTHLQIALDYAKTLDQGIPSVSPLSQLTSTSNGVSTSSYDLNVGVLHHPDKPSDAMTYEISRIDSTKFLIPSRAAIPPKKDSNPRVLPTKKGCTIEQIAYYTDGTGNVRISGPIWEKLDELNKAALLIHEALYRNMRGLGDTDSDRTRKLVGYLFSGMKFPSLVEGVPEKFLTCWSDDEAASFAFLAYPVDQNWMAAQLLVYDGEIMMRKTVAYVPTPALAQKFGLPVSLPRSNGSFLFQDLKDPLLDNPTYAVSYEMDRAGLILSKFGSKAHEIKDIKCNSGFTSIEYGSDGSVGVRRHH